MLQKNNDFIPFIVCKLHIINFIDIECSSTFYATLDSPYIGTIRIHPLAPRPPIFYINRCDSSSTIITIRTLIRIRHGISDCSRETSEPQGLHQTRSKLSSDDLALAPCGLALTRSLSWKTGVCCVCSFSCVENAWVGVCMTCDDSLVVYGNLLVVHFRFASGKFDVVVVSVVL